MDNERTIEEAAASERQAQAEWTLLLARLQAAGREGPRTRRVRRAIACGDFHVDARAVAERLLARLLIS